MKRVKIIISVFYGFGTEQGKEREAGTQSESVKWEHGVQHEAGARAWSWWSKGFLPDTQKFKVIHYSDFKCKNEKKKQFCPKFDMNLIFNHNYIPLILSLFFLSS